MRRPYFTKGVPRAQPQTQTFQHPHPEAADPLEGDRAGHLRLFSL